MKEQELHIRFKDLAGLNFARSCISDYLQRLLPHQHVQVEIALHEAINNALFHGPSNQFITLKLSVLNKRRLIMRVQSEGPGFNVHERLHRHVITEPDEEALFTASGRGLMIIKAMTDQVRYNEQGTEVMLVKHL